MVKIKFFGLVRLDLNTAEVDVEASTLGEAFLRLAELFPFVEKTQFKNFLYYVNGNLASGFNAKRFKLNDGDVIMVMSAVAGG